MAKNTVGYVELEWSCPNCGNKNPGMKKSCSACGAPQPQGTQFELGEKPVVLITDEKKAADAAKGADIYCPFCNTRNSADAQVCIQCGGDLKEGLKRESGRVLSAAPVGAGGEIKCAGCGTLNPVGSTLCKACGAQLVRAQVPAQSTATSAAGGKSSALRPWMALPVIAILAICCLVFGFLFFRTSTLMGQVKDNQWQRSIAIEAQGEVTHEDWRDQVPGGGKILSCEQKYRTRQDNPAPGAKEVCSTELVDQGNGSAKVVERCSYEVYAHYCKYSALEWQNVDKAVAEGNDLQPYWPETNLASGQREGERSETYTVNFETKDGIKQYITSDAALFEQLQPGTEWNLVINTLGIVVEVSAP